VIEYVKPEPQDGAEASEVDAAEGRAPEGADSTEAIEATEEAAA
jgi:hypothetical protein